MAQITKKYIDDHKRSVHTADSFGRAIIERILNESSEKIGGGEVDSVTVDVKFEVAAFEPASCVRVCANINGVQVCYHVNL